MAQRGLLHKSKLADLRDVMKSQRYDLLKDIADGIEAAAMRGGKDE